MTRTKQSFFVDVWVGFHVLFFAVIATVVLMAFDVFTASNSLVVMGPLAVALFVVLGRSGFRLIRNLTSA